MPNPVWPGGLPQTLLLGIRDQRGAATIRFTNDAGPAQVRKIFGNATRQIQRNIILTAAQRATYDTFFVDTLDEGSLPFDFVDPVSLLTCTYRFVQPTEWLHIGTNASGPFCQGTLFLERLP